jgi:hypothetical protein
MLEEMPITGIGKSNDKRHLHIGSPNIYINRHYEYIRLEQ